MSMETKNKIIGGAFLIQETLPEHIFIPEDRSEEQNMIAQSCKDFLETEVFPRLEEIDSMQDPKLMPSLVEKAGELGLCGISVPEQYGGLGMDFNTSLLVAEATGAGHSFAVALSAHTGIGTLPILYYGSEYHKTKYIPKLASGQHKAAYCLTEPDSGSDANSAKTKAILSQDGKYYILNGQKMWITNAGFADILIVFAKIDNDQNLSAFIVERNWEGITMNAEEKKMGIKGSSTRQVFFNGVKVPVANLIPKREDGLKIALNILNIGRIKLAGAAIGASKRVIGLAVNYATERKQFGTQIANFGAIKHKLAQMTALCFATESACYRTGQNIDDVFDELLAQGMSQAKAKLKSAEQLAIECAMMKVHASESLDFIVDEGVQIYGGMGFSAEAPMDRSYRDARINRIFEGTNEINSMLTIDMLIKKELKGELDLLSPAMAVIRELTSVSDFAQETSNLPFNTEKRMVKNLKKAALMIIAGLVQKFKTNLKEEQEILLNLANILMETYVAESTLLRVEKLQAKLGANAIEPYKNLLIIYLHHATTKINAAGQETIMAFAEGDQLKMMLMGLKRFTKIKPANLKQLRRSVADSLISSKKYIF